MKADGRLNGGHVETPQVLRWAVANLTGRWSVGMALAQLSQSKSWTERRAEGGAGGQRMLRNSGGPAQPTPSGVTPHGEERAELRAISVTTHCIAQRRHREGGGAVVNR